MKWKDSLIISKIGPLQDLPIMGSEKLLEALLSKHDKELISEYFAKPYISVLNVKCWGSKIRRIHWVSRIKLCIVPRIYDNSTVVKTLKKESH